MLIVALVSPKGGTGKSTLTAGLATAAALEQPEVRVAIVDLDPQGCLTRWWNGRTQDRPQHCDLGGGTLAAALPGLRAAGFGLLFVDTPPGFSAIQREAVAAADLVLVPTGASPLDLAAIASALEMAQRAGVPHRTVLNRAVFRSRIAGRTVLALRARGGLLWPPVHQRVAVAEAMASGRTALEVRPAGPAARELAALWLGVRAALGEAPRRRPPDQARSPLISIAARRSV